MSRLADLLQPRPLDDRATASPTLMQAEVFDTAPLRVVVPSLDGAAAARSAFGTWPDAAPGDPVRVMLDETGALVAVAWEAA